MDNASIIAKTQSYAQELLAKDSTGHDWWHVYRVWKMARSLAEKEKADLFVVELAALLHDIADWKFNHNDDQIGIDKSREWLISLGVESETVEHVSQIIQDMSFKGAGTQKRVMPTLEGKIVQDADRLDALGAIGIARTFAYGGYKGRPLHDPTIPPAHHASFEAYKNHQGTTINHFAEKLLLLKDLMNTETAKQIAELRHQYMEAFVKQFFSEWEAMV